MPNNYRDENGHYTTKENNGGECLHQGTTQTKSQDEIKNSIRDYYAKKGINREFYGHLTDQEKIGIRNNVAKLYEPYLNIIEEISKRGVEQSTMLGISKRRIAQGKEYAYQEIEKQSPGKKYNRECTIILGLGGSGKSFFAKPLIENGSFEIDADIFKENYIPETSQGDLMERTLNNSKVHDESVEISEEMLKTLMEKGANLVIGKVGGNANKLVAMAKALNEKGYSTNVVYVDLPVEKAIQRQLSRFKSGSTRRLLNPFSSFKDETRIPRTYARLLGSGYIKGGKIYSSDVNYGERPILIKEN